MNTLSPYRFAAESLDLPGWIFWFVVIALIAAPQGPGSAAELTPQGVAVIAARGDRESEELAAYYIKARGIPEKNLCLVDMPREEVCPRDQWTWAIRPEIHKWLEEHDPGHAIKCLVTMRGVPLKVGPAEFNEQRRKYRQFLNDNRNQRLELLEGIAAQLDAIVPQIAIPEPPPGADEPQAPANATAVAKLQANLEKHLRDAQARVSKLEGDERQREAAKLQQLALLAGGARVLLVGMEKQLSLQPAPELRTQFDLLRGRAGGFVEMQMLLEQTPTGYYHDALILAALERNTGLLGAMDWIDKQSEMVNKNETGASLDSELALVHWPDDYELLRWQPNYLRAGYEQSPWPKAFPTLMVARIDAPTLALAKGLIDAAIATEKNGLSGKAYFDARGMGKLDVASPPPGSYEDYDRALLVAEKAIREQTTIETTLNSSPDLFRPGDCPDAALYCGWYSLAKYVDAFTWNRGAVAYHLASSEAETLRDPGSQEWCKKLIEDGVAATIGPVYEPYLTAFPRPEQFFALLLQGELTLVECYYRTLPFNSWMMVLIGDPLYRPFKNRSVVRAGAGDAAIGN